MSFNSVVVTVKDLASGFQQCRYPPFSRSLSQASLDTKTCSSIFFLAPTLRNNTVLIKARQWFGSFAFLCFLLNSYETKDDRKLLKFVRMLCSFAKQLSLIHCNVNPNENFLAGIPDTNWNFMCPKCDFQEKEDAYSLFKNVVRKLPELWLFQIHISIYMYGQNRFFSPCMCTFFPPKKVWGQQLGSNTVLL